MRATEPFALRRGGRWETWVRPGLLVAGAALVLAAGPPARAERLPPEEQAAVNRAIENGAEFLKGAQMPTGTWAADPNAGHQVGYTVLPALTLLECGVPANDPLIQRARTFLRAKSADLDGTYELALSILFLDRLGNPQDKKYIQTFALRLIAGQSPTGGWGYKCPGPKLLDPRTQLDLLTALRQLPPYPADAIPGLADGPGDSPGNSPTTAPNPAGPPPAAAGGPNASLWRGWLGFSSSESKSSSPDSPDKKAAKDAPADRPGQPPAADPKGARADVKPKPAKPYVVPERLRVLPVMKELADHVLQDPEGKNSEIILTTTDNSNTQFAILGLWTAQRHGVPMQRTLQLMVRRFATSQNGNGTWDYPYLNGGGGGGSPPMTAVGLIGLAVGHGLANPEAAPRAVKDPRILTGLAALSRFVGQPAERAADLPMQNLYFLWSVERAAVLYGLAKIGDKDWYRWGAQILLANQTPKGYWEKGQYPGSSPVLDTCLALLFLKRANLVSDLTSRLQVDTAALNTGVLDKITPKPEPPPKPPEPTKTPPPETPRASSPPPEAPVTKAPTPPSAMAPPPAPAPAAAPEESGGKTKWVILFLAVFVVLAGGSVFFVILAMKQKKGTDEDEDRPKKAKTAKAKPKGKPPATKRPTKK